MVTNSNDRAPRRSTIADVARLAGVSRSTVSNAINNQTSKMSEATAKRVSRAITALGYVPDGVARQLKRGHANFIAVIVPSVANPFWGEYVRAVEEYAGTLGFGVVVCNGERSSERERSYAEAMHAQGIRALCFASSPLSIGHLLKLVERGLYIVMVDRSFDRDDCPEIDSVTIDNTCGGSLATKHLIELGHRRIGFLSGPIKTASRRDRFQGHQQVLRDAGIEPNPAWVWQGAKDSEFGDAEGGELGRLGALKLVTGASPVSAIVAINDLYAIGAYAGVRAAGLRVPDDVSIVGFDDIVFSRLIEPPLTTVRQPIEQIAELAVKRLVSRLRGSQCEPDFHCELMPELVTRASTAPPRATPKDSGRQSLPHRGRGRAAGSNAQSRVSAEKTSTSKSRLSKSSGTKPDRPEVIIRSS